MTNDEGEILPEFVPVFPLPETVLFPCALLPLHVFEPRYREMTADALAGESLIATALLKEGYLPKYYSRRAPIHRVVCVGRIVASEELVNGEYNILLRGETRARIVRETTGKRYRQATLEPLVSTCGASKDEVSALRKDLHREVRRNAANDPELADQWRQLFEAPLPLGAIADLIANGLPVTAELRQCLLAEQDTPQRAGMLLEQMRTLAALDRIHRNTGNPREWNMN
jgi:Lon protease-like protein